MLIKVDYPLKRLLTKDLAAEYCDEPLSRFESVCPKKPIRLHEGGKLKWDIKDLDEWIDSRKGKEIDLTIEEIADRL